MKSYNQYTEDFERYKMETGTDPFIEYKDKSTTNERKKEIEDWMFNLFRKKGEIPHTVWNDDLINNTLVSLSEIKAEDVYKNGEFGYSTIGIGVLYHFFPELYDVRKVSSPMSIRDFFNNDDKLRRVIRKALQFTDSEMGIYRLFIICGAGNCSNFRPAAAKSIYEVYGKSNNCKVFDSSAGYGARLMGAHFAKNVSEYLGIDPNTADHCLDEIKFLKNKYDTGTKETVLKMGSEDFTAESFPQYQNYFDLYFTSPPYFNTEMYSESETQSYKKFPTYAKWIKGFYQETIHNACNSLKGDGVFAINIFTKIPKIKELTKLFLADNGWYVFRNDKYMLRSMPGKFEDENGNPMSKNKNLGMNFEPIWVAKHYSQLLKENMIDEETAKRYKERAIRDSHEPHA